MKTIQVTEEQCQMIGNIIERKRRSLRQFMRTNGNDLGRKFFEAAMNAEHELSELLNEVSSGGYDEFDNPKPPKVRGY